MCIRDSVGPGNAEGNTFDPNIGRISVTAAVEGDDFSETLTGSDAGMPFFRLRCSHYMTGSSRLRLRRLARRWRGVGRTGAALLGVALLTVVGARAQPVAPLRVLTYSSEVGLPVNLLKDVALSPTGYVWIATDAGLVRYDGTTFHAYDTRHGLPSPFVKGVAVERSGAVVVVTDEGTVRAHASGDSLVVQPLVPPSATDAVRFAKDAYVARDGAVWIGGSQGVVRVVGGQARVFDFGPAHRTAAIKRGAQLAEADGALYAVSERGGVFRYDAARLRFVPVATRAFTAVTAVEAWPAGGLLVADRSGVTRLVPTADGALRVEQHVPLERCEDAAVAPDGRLWASDFSGSLYTAAPGGAFARVPDLAPTTMSGLTVGCDGVLWVASDNGLMLVVPRAFATLTSTPVLGLESVSATPGGDVYAIDGERLVRGGDGPPGTAPVLRAVSASLDGVASVDATSGTVWLGYRDGRVQRWGERPTVLPTPGFVLSMEPDGAGGLWIALADTRGVLHLSGDGTVRPFGADAGLDGTVLVLRRVGGVLYAGGHEGGALWRYDAARRRFEQILAHAASSDVASVPTVPAVPAVFDVADDGRGGAWIGTAQGLWHVGGGGAVAERVRHPSLDARIRAVLPAPDGTLWIGTDRAFLRFDGVSAALYGRVDGLVNPTLALRSLATDLSLIHI